jgi:hypothetical protein
MTVTAGRLAGNAAAPGQGKRVGQQTVAGGYRVG